MTAPREAYARRAISQIPRLLSNQDRNRYSPTFGCFHRDYWLDKSSDFPDAVRQFAVHALALVYKYDFPGNIYKGQPLIREWAIAGLDFWAGMQHGDGSFDEFYPYERGWVGPTGFTTYTAVEAYRLLQDEVPSDAADRILEAVRRAARFIARGQSEEDHLANHYAMAYLAVSKAYRLLGDPELENGLKRLWHGFLGYHNASEGWSREYDGTDPGYLSATISFLAKVYQSDPDPEILEVLTKAVEFCSYFVYPDGFYAGSLGSRNTVHFYPHGFEILGGEVHLATSVAERMLQALSEGKLAPPEVVSDRYVAYRVSEYLQAYLDYSPRPLELQRLPYERPPFTHYFPGSRIECRRTESEFVVANLAKGGVVKAFDVRSGKLLLDDSGIIGRLDNGRIVTSQWIDPAYECKTNGNGWEVEGYLQAVPSGRPFSVLKHILFRVVLFIFGRIPRFSHLLKGYIRRTLILGQRSIPVRFHRRFEVASDAITLTDELIMEKKVRLVELTIGGQFFVRYVPQSRYFQGQELESGSRDLSSDELKAFDADGRIILKRKVKL